MDLDGVIREQIDYYRARASEYDEWWDRRGRYDRGREANAAWFADREIVENAFDSLHLRGDVLELAAGTGIWTERVARTATHVTAVDASPEMIERNRRRLGARSSKVDYVAADLFAWEPEGRFDAVVLCFWLSHVPSERLDAFVAVVARTLRPGGSAFFLDSKRVASSTAVDHRLPAVGDQVTTRRLNDGSTHLVVKNFRSSRDIEGTFAAAGLDVVVRETPAFFQYGIGVRR